MTLLKRVLIVIALVAAAFLLILGTNWLSTLAYAQPSVCQAEINDNAHLLRPEERTAILAAVAEVESLGADVHVWTFGELPNPDAATGDADKDELQVWMDQQERKCAEWQRPNNAGRKGNLIVLAFSLNPLRSALFAGDAYDNSIKPVSETIRKSMSPAFKDGKIGEGFITGLHNIRDTIAPPKPSEPIDLSWLWYVLYAIIGIVVIVILIVLFIRVRRHLVHGREERREAAEGTTRVAQHVMTLEGHRTDLEPRVSGIGDTFTEEDYGPIRELWERFLHWYGELTTEQGEILGTVEDRDAQQRSRAAAIILDAEQADEAHAQALEVVRQLTEAIDTLTTLPTSLPGRVETVRTLIASCRGRVQAITDEGFTTTSQETQISDADTQLFDAETARTGRRYNAASSLLDEAEKLARGAATDAEQLPKTKARLVGQVAKIRTRRRPSLQERITTVTATFTSLQAEFAAVHSDDLSDNCTTAQTLLDGVEAILVRVEVEIEEQNWELADQILAEAGTQLSGAFTLLQAIINRYNELTERRMSALQRATDAREAIQGVRTYIATHQDDITTDVRDQLVTAEGHITAAQRELAQTQPNLNRVTTLLDDADSQTSSARETVEGEHHAAERQRRRAAELRAEAATAVSRARNYVSSNRSRVNSSTRTDIEDLDRQLREVDDADLAQQIVLAQALAEAARSLHDQAQQDVSDNTPSAPSSYGSGSTGTNTSGDLGTGGTNAFGDFGGTGTNSSGEL